MSSRCPSPKNDSARKKAKRSVAGNRQEARAEPRLEIVADESRGGDDLEDFLESAANYLLEVWASNNPRWRT
jgi:hypothetical protein